MMRPTRVQLVLCGAAALSILVYAYLRLRHPPPRLNLDAAVHDFGAVEPGKVVQHVFLLQNTGGRPLVIEAVRSSCPCTDVRLSRGRIPPGASAELHVGLRVARRNAATSARILVLSNDRKESPTVLVVKARTNPVLDVSPSVVDFGRISHQRDAPALVKLSLLAQHPDQVRVNVEDVLHPSPVQAFVDGREDQPLLVVSLARDAPVGPLTADIILTPAQERSPPLRLSVRGRVVGPVRADPPWLDFGVVNRSGRIAREVHISTQAPREPLHIANARFSDNLASFARCTTDRGGVAGVLQVDLDLERVPLGQRALTGVLLVTCSGKSTVTVTIPIKLWIDEGS